MPRRPQRRDDWSVYFEAYGSPNPRSKFYDLLEEQHDAGTGYTYEYWPGERKPRRVRQRPE
jgi:hypothetical protein